MRRIHNLWKLKSLISSCNNLTSAFGIYDTLTNHQKPTLGVFKSLLKACLELRPKRANEVWKEMVKHSVVPDTPKQLVEHVFKV